MPQQWMKLMISSLYTKTINHPNKHIQMTIHTKTNTLNINPNNSTITTIILNMQTIRHIMVQKMLLIIMKSLSTNHMISKKVMVKMKM